MAMGEAPGPGSNDLTVDDGPDRPPETAAPEPAVTPTTDPAGPDPFDPAGLVESADPVEPVPADPVEPAAQGESAVSADPVEPTPAGPVEPAPQAPAEADPAPQAPADEQASPADPTAAEPEGPAPVEPASPAPTPADAPDAAPAPTPADAPDAADVPAPAESTAPAAASGSGQPAQDGRAKNTKKTKKGGQGPGRGSRRPPKPPTKIVDGVVTEVSPREVVLQLDDGRTGVISSQNFGPGPETPEQVLSVGDRCFGAELARHDPQERVVLSRAWALKTQAWEGVVAAAAGNTTVTGTITSAGGKGAVVDVGLPGFVPTSHLSLTPIDDLASYVGQRLEFRVLEADPARDRLVLSRRALLMKEQRRRAQTLLAELKAGDRRTGTVASLADYGAFVELGEGLSGLVHLSELSWSRVRRPADVVSVGDEVEVEVLDVKAKKRRVSLSIRRLVPDPMAEIEVGQVYTGPVTRLVDFGAFVAVNGVEGLVHLSELAEHRVASAAEIVAPGQEVWVKVLSVDRRRRRLELSIRRAAEYG
ncbi:MAG: S1 RNA-binding domain-containing protein [Acidimicrobiales bacterium]